MTRIVSFITSAYGLAVRIGNRLQWAGPTIARLVVGYVFFVSGWGKLTDLQSVTEFFAELGIPAPAFQAVLASTSEFVCGGLLLAGLATRLAVVPLIITMIVAIRTALWADIDSTITLFGKAEFLYIALLAWLGTTGPGPISLDYLVQRLTGERAKYKVVTRSEGSAIVIQRVAAS
jgi:putative oxidoreductase